MSNLDFTNPEGEENLSLEHADFYDALAGEYSSIVKKQENDDVRNNFFRHYLSAGSTVLDVGCGIGSDSIRLAHLGFKVTGIDPSAKMVEQAKARALHNSASCFFIHTSVEMLSPNYNGTFDAVAAMGNTFAHFPSVDAGIKALLRPLAPNGTFILHLLNYAKVLARQERIVGITTDSGICHIRFYDFLPPTLRFNVLSFQADTPSKRSLHSTVLYPHTSEQLRAALESLGAHSILCFGDFTGSIFLPEVSPNLIIIAKNIRE